jgi:ABC-2 type transport system permease protein
MNDRVWVLAKRELSSFFFSPVAYVVMSVFLVISGVIFANEVFVPGREAQMRGLFDWQAFMLVFFLPALTMRVISEELKSGTIETLMTAPIKDWEVIAGKFMGTWLFYLGMLATTLLYAVLLLIYGQADAGQIATGYLGLALLGGLYIAVSMLMSSLTQHQVISAFLSILVLATFTFLLFRITHYVSTKWQDILRSLNLYERFSDFSAGLIDIQAVVFFVSITAGILFAAVKVLESRRWR